ncbi:hypothetical protein H6F67_20065 [Microcoleus sp. FACHB-1515]|uniref:hypothetical protein n=1 Tax=Cyanophyceae TaxID=3028117 RepID=UPI001683E45D|nr:hypothetical protein [Microcoleus sp. FACHB-1515]MBD2092148.1 hypothetical protein [Microcoleus sp. FACHB-1515]
MIGEIKLLQQIYSKILIPPAVHDELMRLPEIQATIASGIGAGWLEIQIPNNLQLIQNLRGRLKR